ncbi:MAG TPA: hypothetical protein VGH30_07630 [Jatrophihabitantaceae bacterium]
MNLGPGEYLVLWLMLSVATGVVGYSWRSTPRNFARFFLLGAIFPIAGLTVAIVVKRYVGCENGMA